MEQQVATAPEILIAETSRKKQFDKNKWYFSLGGIGRDMAYQLISTFLLAYVQFGIPLTLAQFTTISLAIGVGGRIWDAINDPMMGAIIESSHMKFGKFKPWILIGAVSCGAVIVAMFNIQNTFSGWGFVAFMIIMYLLWESTFTMNDIGYWSMLASLSSVKKERNQITMLTVLFAGVGAIIAQGIIPTLATGDVRNAYRWISVLVVGVFIGCQFMTSLCVKETPHAEDSGQEKVTLKKMWNTIKKNDQVLWMTLSMLFYNIGSALLIALALNLLFTEVGYSGANYFYIVAVYGVISVVVNIIYPALANKLGRRKLQLFSILLACVGYLAVACMGWGGSFSMPIFCVFAAFISAGQSLFYMASIINMTNCVEYNHYKQGERNEAVVSTLRPFMAKFAGAMQYGITTLVLVISGVFIMSQAVSTLETQKSMFEGLDTSAQQSQYVESIQEFIDIYDYYLLGLTEGTDEYNQAMKSARELVDSKAVDNPNTQEVEVISTVQLDTTHDYVKAIGDVLIVRNYYTTENGKPENLKQRDILGRLDDINPQDLNIQSTNDNIYYVYTFELGDYKLNEDESVPTGVETNAKGEIISAADLNFKQKVQGKLSARLWLRFAVTILPTILLLTALFIQRKKFIIDESYYDMMCEEIAKREGNSNVQEE
ncbi:MAG: MFS transporter [Clostridia bacterium]|nr:MFS transporter [Clostridia bacterium]